MRIPRVIESTLAEDWTSPWTGNTFKKNETRVTIQSELQDNEHGICSVSLPNPVPAYLAIVEDALETARQTRIAMYKGKTAYERRSGTEVYGTLDSEVFDEYFQLAAVLVTFAFMALEAWCNQMIPEDYIYIRQRPHKYLRFIMREEKLNKIAIERWISLDDKLVHIVPTITSKPHFKTEVLWQRYKRANAARDEFTHLKSPARLRNDKTNYDPFFQRVLNIDLQDVASLPKDIMTYFIPKDLGF